MWAKEKKWIIVGIITLVINNLSVYLFSILINIQLSLIASAEISILARYFLNEKFVFQGEINKLRLLKFHLLNFSSFLVYFSTVFLLHTVLKFNLFLAVNLGTIFSFFINYIGSFFLLWKK